MAPRPRARAPEPDASPLSRLTRRLDAATLAGERLPEGFLADLLPLSPAERLLAVAHARRLGLLTSGPLSLEQLLGAAEGDL